MPTSSYTCSTKILPARNLKLPPTRLPPRTCWPQRLPRWLEQSKAMHRPAHVYCYLESTFRGNPKLALTPRCWFLGTLVIAIDVPLTHFSCSLIFGSLVALEVERGMDIFFFGCFEGFLYSRWPCSSIYFVAAFPYTPSILRVLVRRLRYNTRRTCCLEKEKFLGTWNLAWVWTWTSVVRVKAFCKRDFQHVERERGKSLGMDRRDVVWTSA